MKRTPTKASDFRHNSPGSLLIVLVAPLTHATLKNRCPMSVSRADADPDDLKIIRLNTHRIDEPDAAWSATYPYKLTANLRPPEFMQVTFICLHGGSEEMVLRGKTPEAINRFIAQNDLRHHPRLRAMIVTGPDGVIEEIRR